MLYAASSFYGLLFRWSKPSNQQHFNTASNQCILIFLQSYFQEHPKEYQSCIKNSCRFLTTRMPYRLWPRPKFLSQTTRIIIWIKLLAYPYQIIKSHKRMTSSKSEEVIADDVLVQAPNLMRASSKRPKALQEIIRIKNHEINDPNSSQKNGSMVMKASLFLRKFSRPSHCEICEEEVLINRKVFIADCEHKGMFCESCLHHYAVYTIEQFGKVRCPSSGCEFQLQTDTAFFNSLPATIQTKYHRILRFYAAIDDPSLRLCPREACQGTLRLNEQSLRCDACNAQFCSQCLLPTHVGGCDSFQLQFFEQTLRYRQCPRCRAFIDKFQGCNHMTCLCKHQFCYVCGADWHNDHYNNHDQNGNFIPPAPAPAPEILYMPNIEARIQPNVSQQQQDQGCFHRRPDRCFYITLFPRIILFLVLLCLLIALFGLVVTLTILALCTTGKRKNHAETAADREYRRKTGQCIDDMCSGYFRLYKLLAHKLLSP